MQYDYAYAYTLRTDENSSERRFDSYAFDERYDHDHELVTDGGRSSAFDVPEPGDIVHDRESTHGDDRLLVLGVREETTAEDEYIQQIGATVADVNPEYSPHAPIARCVYYEEVATVDPQASIDDVRAAASLDVFNSYTFPVDRLAGDVDAAGGDDQ
jgi:hypothetical protein